MSVTLVRQEHEWGCGVAVLAMVTGQTYAAVLADLEADPWNHSGMYAGGVAQPVLERYLTSRGWFMRRVYSSWETDGKWPPDPFAPVHTAIVGQPSGSGHFVVMDDQGCVFDPLSQDRRSLAEFVTVSCVMGWLLPDLSHTSRPEGGDSANA